jgi:hypothetical protein
MSKQTINNGSTANDGTGDTLREMASKVNGNFDELYASTYDNNGGSVIDSIKTELAASTDFADFQSRIAAL